MLARLIRLKLYPTLVASMATLSCSGEIGQVEPGLLSLQLQPAAAVQLSELEYTVSHEKGFVRSGPVAVGDTESVSFKVYTLPPALGYEVTAIGHGLLADSDESTVCTGQAAFEIKTAQATSVSMTLQCDGVAGEIGTTTETEQGSTSNKCPHASSITASPEAIAVGAELFLSADVAEDDDGPLPLALRWSADSGVFARPSAAKTPFLCNRPGVVEVYFSMSDGDQACDAEPLSISVTCVGGACIDATHCPSNPAGTSGASKAAGGMGGVAGHAGSSSTGGAGASASAGHGSVIQKSTGAAAQGGSGGKGGNGGNGGRGGSGGSVQAAPAPSTPNDMQSKSQRRPTQQPRTNDWPRAGRESMPLAGAASTTNTDNNPSAAGSSGAVGSTGAAGAGGVGNATGQGGAAAPRAGTGAADAGMASNDAGPPPVVSHDAGTASGAGGAGSAADSGGAESTEQDEEP